MRLHDVAFCENFACNLVSLRLLRRKGYWWDNKVPNNYLRRKDDSIICSLIDRHDQFVIEDIQEPMTKASFGARRNRINSWTERSPSSANGHIWHLRLGHPGPAAIDHLPHHSRGVRIKGLSTAECDACGRAKAKRLISRRPRERPNKPGQRLAVDFLDFEPDPKGYWCAMLITDRYSNYVFDIYLISRDTDALISAFKELLGKLANQYQLFPEAIECDNEIRDNHRLVAFFNQERHIRLEPSAPYTQEQNGGAERSGGVIKAMAAAMRAAAKLPHFLWTEIVRAAIYLTTPRISIGSGIR